MTMNPDQLNRARIVQNIAVGDHSLDVEVFDQLPSTNSYLAESAKNSSNKNSSLAVADSQTAGVGRRGKSWVSEPGNISMSLLSHFEVPPSRLMGLSLVAGVTVASVLRESASIECQLKWPNDILVDGAKLAGILIEIPRSSSSNCSIVTGIGINYQALTGDTGVGQQTASLESSHARLSRSELIGKITSGLLVNYPAYCQQGLAVFAGAWGALDYLNGRPVTVFLHDKNIEGVAVGIADNGELMVDVDGNIQTFNSGEVSVRRR